ncbi:universal stress protein [Geobacter grbiciae]|uniref:universal stress protein n=1 Tax=Geobacter grbiciae TaxID=155042 RepID=UPI001C038E90|nr:universal stress protein [Geobacter grbiciae]MBT1074717.1 universal stress protein [Geobacter grbiciae]
MSYRKIFSVINEHTASTVTARYAISLAAAGKADLVLYAAHAENSDETVLRHTDRHLDHLFTVAFELDIAVTRITEVGNISTLLPKRVDAEKADLVWYPLTPYERYGADLQQHTVHSLLRTIRSDLAIMRAITMAKPHPRRILVPLGKVISDRDHRLVFITELARSFHSQVTLFHLSAERDAKGMPDDITRFREQLQQQDVAVLERSGKGDIGKSITVEAITRHNDLIVLGASERGVLQKLFFGNPAGDVMHKPPCNAILFRSAP